jgi:hypothetical protein
MLFGINGSERMRINTGGNVGIGTSSPAGTLQVFAGSTIPSIKVGEYQGANTFNIPLIESFGSRSDGNTTFYGRFGASFRRTDGTAIQSAAPIGMYAFGAQWGTDTTYQSAKLLYTAGIMGVAEGVFSSATAMPTALVFTTGSTGGAYQSANTAYGSERMRIDSSGNVGIGTGSPSIYAKFVSQVAFNGTAVAASFNNISNVSVNTVVAADFWADQAQSRISSNRDGAGNSSTLMFSTSTTGTLAERMRIDSSGNVLVATTSLVSGVIGKLFVNAVITGAAYQTRAGGAGAYGGNSFNIDWTGSPQLWIDNTNIGTFAFTSDYRIKKNIETNTTPALERIAQVRPVTYEFANYGELFKEDGVEREGFIAHELQAVIPSAVEGEKDAENKIQSLKLDALCSVMVKAIQELNAKVTALEAQLNKEY